MHAQDLGAEAGGPQRGGNRPVIAAGGIDAVTVTTPPQTRRALVLEAIDAGIHVTADKTLAPSAAAVRKLDAARESVTRGRSVDVAQT